MSDQLIRDVEMYVHIFNDKFTDLELEFIHFCEAALRQCPLLKVLQK